MPKYSIPPPTVYPSLSQSIYDFKENKSWQIVNITVTLREVQWLNTARRNHENWPWPMLTARCKNAALSFEQGSTPWWASLAPRAVSFTFRLCDIYDQPDIASRNLGLYSGIVCNRRSAVWRSGSWPGELPFAWKRSYNRKFAAWPL